jgi:hypothetical protein
MYSNNSNRPSTKEVTKMIEVEKLREMSTIFKQSNPRYIDYSADTIWLAVKSQTGQTLTAQELRVFLSALTGYPFMLSTAEKAIANAPEWIKKQM